MGRSTFGYAPLCDRYPSVMRFYRRAEGEHESTMVRSREHDRDEDVTTDMTSRRMAASADNGASLYAAPSWRHGRGVFAVRRFRKGEIVERCPVLTVSARDRGILDETVVGSYLYERGRGGAIALGMGSLFNHSFNPNAACELDEDEGVAEFRALRTIQPGDEITILYCDDEEDLWFEPRDNGEQARKGAASASRTKGKKKTKNNEAQGRDGRGQRRGRSRR